jgi:hypothetical protein
VWIIGITFFDDLFDRTTMPSARFTEEFSIGEIVFLEHFATFAANEALLMKVLSISISVSAFNDSTACTAFLRGTVLTDRSAIHLKGTSYIRNGTVAVGALQALLVISEAHHFNMTGHSKFLTTAVADGIRGWSCLSTLHAARLVIHHYEFQAQWFSAFVTFTTQQSIMFSSMNNERSENIQTSLMPCSFESSDHVTADIQSTSSAFIQNTILMIHRCTL